MLINFGEYLWNVFNISVDDNNEKVVNHVKVGHIDIINTISNTPEGCQYYKTYVIENNKLQLCTTSAINELI